VDAVELIVKIFTSNKIQDGGQRPNWKWLNRTNSAGDCPILWKFGRLMLLTPCFQIKWTLCYFIISLLWRLQIAWKFPEVHRRCCLLWICNKCLWFI